MRAGFTTLLAQQALAGQYAGGPQPDAGAAVGACDALGNCYSIRLEARLEYRSGAFQRGTSGLVEAQSLPLDGWSGSCAGSKPHDGNATVAAVGQQAANSR